MKISVVIITKNAEKKIAKCLESVKWADEVIVVDGFSTDRTIEMARSVGAKVIQRKFTGSFADDRNTGMDEARNDWVLQLDADEVVRSGFEKKAEDSVSSCKDAAAFKFRRVNFFLGHSMDHGGFHHHIPNFVNRRLVRFEGPVHEVPVCKGDIAVIDADIEHHPFDSLSQFVQRQDRYADIAAAELLKKNGILPLPEIKRNMIGRSFKIFFKSYFKKQGYKEGIYGLVFAILFAFINFLKWAKYWELTRNEQL